MKVSPAFNAGPADATVSSKTDSEVTRETGGEEAAILVTPSHTPGVQELTPIELWNIALKKHKLLEQCEQICEQALATEGNDNAESADQLRAQALAKAVHALRDMGNNKQKSVSSALKRNVRGRFFYSNISISQAFSVTLIQLSGRALSRALSLW